MIYYRGAPCADTIFLGITDIFPLREGKIVVVNLGGVGDFLTKLHRKPGERGEKSTGESAEKHSGDGAPKLQISVPCRGRTRPDLRGRRNWNIAVRSGFVNTSFFRIQVISRARKPWSANCELKHWNFRGWKRLIHDLHFTVSLPNSRFVRLFCL